MSNDVNKIYADSLESIRIIRNGPHDFAWRCDIAAGTVGGYKTAAEAMTAASNWCKEYADLWRHSRF
jgi:hypothetical protein